VLLSENSHDCHPRPLSEGFSAIGREYPLIGSRDFVDNGERCFYFRPKLFVIFIASPPNLDITSSSTAARVSFNIFGRIDREQSFAGSCELFLIRYLMVPEAISLPLRRDATILSRDISWCCRLKDRRGLRLLTLESMHDKTLWPSEMVVQILSISGLRISEN